MKTVIFIEIKGVIHFKCDSFWSMSQRPDHAKVYSSDGIDDLKSWLQSVLPTNIYKDKMDYVRDRYHGSKLGYFSPDEILYKNSFILKDETLVEDLGPPKYLWKIEMNDTSEWIITKEDLSDKPSIYVDRESLGRFIDYRQFNRDEVIDSLLKEKDSDI